MVMMGSNRFPVQDCKTGFTGAQWYICMCYCVGTCYCAGKLYVPLRTSGGVLYCICVCYFYRVDSVIGPIVFPYIVIHQTCSSVQRIIITRVRS